MEQMPLASCACAVILMSVQRDICQGYRGRAASGKNRSPNGRALGKRAAHGQSEHTDELSYPRRPPPRTSRAIASRECPHARHRRELECAPGGGHFWRLELTIPAGLPEDGNRDEAPIAQRRLQTAGR